MRFRCDSSSSLMVVPTAPPSDSHRVSPLFCELAFPCLDILCQPSHRPISSKRVLGAHRKLTKHDRATLLMRKRSESRASIQDAIAMAKKREQVKANVAKSHKSGQAGYSFVYVGNVRLLLYKSDFSLSYLQIEPFITKDRLKSWFSRCGPISRIFFRCRRGQAIPRGVPVPAKVRTARDRQYATVEFSDSNAATIALGLNGCKLDGCELVVCVLL
jgi:translation initiation factor 4A